MKRILACVLFAVLWNVAARAEIIGMQVERAVSEDEMKASLRQVELVDEKGAPLDLNRLIGDGKPTLVTLWAHWCTNCRAEISGFKTIANACPNRWNVVFVSARRNDYPKDLAAFKSFGLPWKFYNVAKSAQSDVAKARVARAFYGATPDGGIVTPLHYFISSTGAVEAIVNGRMDFTEPQRLAAFCEK